MITAKEKFYMQYRIARKNKLAIIKIQFIKAIGFNNRITEERDLYTISPFASLKLKQKLFLFKNGQKDVLKHYVFDALYPKNLKRKGSRYTYYG